MVNILANLVEISILREILMFFSRKDALNRSSARILPKEFSQGIAKGLICEKEACDENSELL